MLNPCDPRIIGGSDDEDEDVEQNGSDDSSSDSDDSSSSSSDDDSSSEEENNNDNSDSSSDEDDESNEKHHHHHKDHKHSHHHKHSHRKGIDNKIKSSVKSNGEGEYDSIQGAFNNIDFSSEFAPAGKESSKNGYSSIKNNSKSSKKTPAEEKRMEGVDAQNIKRMELIFRAAGSLEDFSRECEQRQVTTPKLNSSKKIESSFMQQQQQQQQQLGAHTIQCSLHESVNEFTHSNASKTTTANIMSPMNSSKNIGNNVNGKTKSSTSKSIKAELPEKDQRIIPVGVRFLKVDNSFKVSLMSTISGIKGDTKKVVSASGIQGHMCSFPGEKNYAIDADIGTVFMADPKKLAADYQFAANFPTIGRSVQDAVEIDRDTVALEKGSDAIRFIQAYAAQKPEYAPILNSITDVGNGEKVSVKKSVIDLIGQTINKRLGEATMCKLSDIKLDIRRAILTREKETTSSNELIKDAAGNHWLNPAEINEQAGVEATRASLKKSPGSLLVGVELLYIPVE